MSPDPERFAALLAGYCLDVQPGQQVLVRSTTQAAPLLLALQREILGRDAWPAMRVSLPGQTESYWAAARKTWGFDERKARTLTGEVDNDPNMPDALEVAAAQDRQLALQALGVHVGRAGEQYRSVDAAMAAQFG